MSLRIFTDIGEILTLEGAVRKGARRIHEDDLSILRQATLISFEGKIVWLGQSADFSQSLLKQWPGRAEFISLAGKTVMPGFIEPHTHLVFAGDRSQEFEWRMQGQSYQEIAAQGGGIRFTVDQTRQASRQDLLDLARLRCERFKLQGVTTLEVKSGYGLDLETEQRLLEVARALQGPNIVTTYLGAHSRSPDFADLDAYLRFMCDQVLPALARTRLADRVDIYIEQGFFNLTQAETYLTRARDLGFAITGHGEQLSCTGACDLLLRFSAQSVDHAVFVNTATIAKLAASATTAVLLPTSDFYLNMQYPPARQMIEAGVRVALSTDFNPGTSPTQDLSLVGVLARLKMQMTLPEVIVAYTLGAAFALGKELQVGSLSVGKNCDFIVSSESWRSFFYSVGQHPVEAVFRSGQEL